MCFVCFVVKNSCTFVFIRGNNSCIKSFRMTTFAPREAMTTAESPEPLDFSASKIHFIQTNPSAD